MMHRFATGRGILPCIHHYKYNTIIVEDISKNIEYNNEMQMACNAHTSYFYYGREIAHRTSPTNVG